MLLPMLKLEHDGVQTVGFDFPTHNYSSRQSAAFRLFMEILKVSSFPFQIKFTLHYMCILFDGCVCCILLLAYQHII